MARSRGRWSTTVPAQAARCDSTLQRSVDDLSEIRDEVNVEEFVALEALRLFEPNVHSRIKDIPQYLMAYGSDEAKASVMALYDLGSPEGRPQPDAHVGATVPRHFLGPASARRFTNAKSVSNPAKFAVYFQFGLIPGALTEGEYARALTLAIQAVRMNSRSTSIKRRRTRSVALILFWNVRWSGCSTAGRRSSQGDEPLTVLSGIARLNDAQVLQAESAGASYVDTSLRALSRQLAKLRSIEWALLRSTGSPCR